MNEESTPPRASTVALVLAVSVFLTCEARRGEFYEKVFPCETGDPGECGSTRDGKPMTCYPGHLLGGQDFCTATCDTTASSDTRFTCLAMDTKSNVGALVQRCKPHAGGEDPKNFGCPSGLSCYRTDLLADDGICLMMTVCSENNDCVSSEGGTACGGSLVRGVVASSDKLQTDSLQCIHIPCSTRGSSCPPDQACLLDYYASDGMLPDICVPKCRAGTCPPNFACAQSDDVPGADAICLPGIPGARCSTSSDCLFGECLDTGAGFNVCTLPMPCKPFDYCSNLDGPVDVFVCAEGVPGEPRCVTTRPFGGTSCKTTPDCAADPNRECLWLSATQADPKHGDCRLRCNADGRCDPRGGIPFFCLGENREGGCHPTGFGMPCLDDSECYGDLKCKNVGSDERSRTKYNPNICTLACLTDADCDANHLTFHAGFCQTGFCRLAGETGLPCTQASHCRSKQCNRVTATCF